MSAATIIGLLLALGGVVELKRIAEALVDLAASAKAITAAVHRNEAQELADRAVRDELADKLGGQR